MAAAVAISPTPILQFFNNLGAPNAGGTLLTQVGGLNYPTYQDSGGSTALPNPIPLNSRGEISDATGHSQQCFLVSGVVYTFTLFDAAGNQLNQATYVVNSLGTVVPYAVDTGAVNAITVALPTVGSYYDGLIIAVRQINNNTGAMTIAVGSLGTKAVVSSNNAPMQAGQCSAGLTYFFIYSTAGTTGFVCVGTNDRKISATAFAADPTGVTDATSAINNALNAAALVGGTVELLAGTYKISGAGLAVNQSAYTGNGIDGTTTPYNKRVSLCGASDGNTIIVYPVASGTNAAFTFTGYSGAYSSPTSYGWYTRFSIENIHFVGPGNTSTNIGLQITLAATWSLRNVTVSGFGTGMQATDCIGALIENSNFMFNALGAICAPGAQSVSPNAITFRQCAFMYNTNQGLHMQEPSGCDMYGGYVQNNGNTGAATFKYGMYVDNNAAGSGNGVAMAIHGVWFESNGDGTANSWADLLVWPGGTGTGTSSTSVIGCTFERAEPNSDGHNWYCTNNIQWDPGNNYKCSLTVIGCTFQAFNTYVSNSARPYLAITNGTKSEFIEFGNLYADPINAGTSEKPVFVTLAGVAPTVTGQTRNKFGQLGAWGNFTGSGGGIVINQGFNIASATRNSAGNYTINFVQGLGASPCGTVTVAAAAGYAYVSSATTSSVTIITNNTSDVATDNQFTLMMAASDMVA